MSGIVKAVVVGAAAVFASDMASKLDVFKDMPDIGKYAGAGAGAFLAMKFL